MNTAFEMPLFDELNRQSEFVFIRSKDGDIQGVYVYVNLLKACFRIETRACCRFSATDFYSSKRSIWAR